MYRSVDGEGGGVRASHALHEGPATFSPDASEAVAGEGGQNNPLNLVAARATFASQITLHFSNDNG
jgi:hypothetical protein